MERAFLDQNLKKSEQNKISAIKFFEIINRNGKIKFSQIEDDIKGTEAIVKTKHIDIQNCTIDGDFLLENIKSIENLFFENCIFNERVLLFHSHFKTIQFNNCIFLKNFTTTKLQCDTFRINNCSFNNFKELDIHDFSCKSLYFTKNEASHDIHIKPIEALSVKLEGGEKEYQVTFSYYKNKTVLDKLLIVCSSNYQTEYLIRNITIKHFQLTGESKSSIRINAIKLKLGLWDNFSNQGILKLDSISPMDDKSLLVIKDSTLGKSEINNISFPSFHRIILNNSNVIDIIPVNVTWCVSNQLESDSIQTLKENYRQLKIVGSKNDDVSQKLFFEKLEMHTLLKQLRKEKKSLFNRLILQTSFLSNDFGFNWVRAILWLFSTSILFYTLIKYSVGETHLDFSFFWDDFGRMLLFLNPVHQFDKLFRVEDIGANLGGALAFDGIARILCTYFIFQFVSAFRKYFKR